MDLSTLKPAEGSVKKKTRIARGQGSGKGGTATRGHKGAKSRSGYKKKRGFEGGQMPLQQRIPKRGFKNPNRKSYVAINLDYLQEMSDKFEIKEVTPEVLKERGIIKSTDLIKLLGRGELNKTLTIKVNAASESAVKAVEAKGGTVTIV
ncbi:50S ribosomal protein L15 [Portibacter marinus]|uniref:50S ribosomal protein L15 n=1 Tax=Portibacter marinus TaxID=2898660 RepID=UPI001F227CA6|nr:50S ribosomal protein L15 [Portibacter marinus]